jgi:ABC-type branched-subunit amino acid transport system substrate-binding protein
MSVKTAMTRTGLSIGVLASTAALAACGSEDGGGGGASAAGSSKEPLTVALVSQYGGPLAQFGNDAYSAWQLAADEANAKGGVDGHKVKILKVETTGDPAATLRAARGAVTKDKVKFLSGILTSGENASLAPQLAGMGALNIATVPKDDSLTGKACSPNMYRITTSAGMDASATGSILPTIPAKKWAILALDILLGHSAADSFKAEAAKSGKQVVSTQFAPLGATDFGSFITKIKSSGADGLFVLESGADAATFVKQGAQFKLFDSMQSVVTQSMLAEPLFKAMGDSIVGWYDRGSYMEQVDTPQNKAFVAEWSKQHESKLWNVPGDSYIGAQFLFEAVRKAKSVDVAKVKAAMNDLSIDTIAGPLTMRSQDHQALRPTYVGQIVKGDDGLGWKIVQSVPPEQTSPTPNAECKL